jgi:Condensation domain
MNKKYSAMTAIVTEQPSVDGRKLGALEQLFSLVDRHRPVHFAVAAHIEGQTTPLAWRRALDSLQERHPLLSVAIEPRADGNHYFRTVATFSIPLRVVEYSGESSWVAEMAKELAVPFPPKQVPLVRAVLLHGRHESVLILIAHHSVADGLSLSYAVRDLLQALGGETLEPLSPLPALEPLVYMSQDAPDDGNDHAPSEAPQDDRPVTFRAIDDSLPCIESLRLTPELTTMLIERARGERTTVHGALCSALVLAGGEITDEWNGAPVRVLSPFNLRRQLGVGEDCGLFVWAGIVPVTAPANGDFWEIARSMKASLARKQSLRHVALEMEGLEHAMATEPDVHAASQILAQGFPCELLLTNLGILPCHFDYRDLKLKALWGPAVHMGFEGQQTVGVTTTNGSLCLLHTSFSPLPSLLKRAERILRFACE